MDGGLKVWPDWPDAFFGAKVAAPRYRLVLERIGEDEPGPFCRVPHPEDGPICEREPGHRGLHRVPGGPTWRTR